MDAGVRAGGLSHVSERIYSGLKGTALADSLSLSVGPRSLIASGRAPTILCNEIIPTRVAGGLCVVLVHKAALSYR